MDEAACRQAYQKARYSKSMAIEYRAADEVRNILGYFGSDEFGFIVIISLLPNMVAAHILLGPRSSPWQVESK